MRPGEVVAERFQIEKLAGTGGMGEVYRALDRRSGAPVAVKVLHGKRDEQIARFDRESRVLAILDHPAIVRFVDYGVTASGAAFLAMEWLEGEALSDRLARGRLTPAEAMALALVLADALGAAHRAGVVHRDLKPSNVMLARGFITRPKLVDFGIAHAEGQERLTETGATVGTVGYMAPEQARGEPDIDARADVFAFGALLFECLSGRPPFDGDDPLATLLRVATEEAPRLSSVIPTTPAVLDDFMARLLARDRARRPADGDAVAQAMRGLPAFLPTDPPLGMPFPPAGPPSLASPPASAPWSAPSPASQPISQPFSQPASRAAPTVIRPAARVPARRNLGLLLVGAGVAFTLVAGLAVALLVGLSSSSAGPSGSGAPGKSWLPSLGECASEHCEPFDTPNAGAFDVVAALPRIKATVARVDPSAQLTHFGGPDSGGRAVYDLTGTPALGIGFKSTRKGGSVLAAVLVNGRLNFRWNESHATWKELGAAPDPRCPMTKVAAAARARGVTPNPNLIFNYSMVTGTPVWSVTGKTSVWVKDATCEVWDFSAR